jgi:DNA repair exonuclease SbcCD nuclease subunit
MKVAIITDTHFGGKNDNLQFAQFQQRFYEGTFFPICKREGVTTIFHLGDVFDRRKYSNFNTLKLAKEMFFDPARDFKVHMLVGNHDAYFKNNNDVNSVELTCAEYNNITLYKDIPEVVEFQGLHVFFIPWIAPANYTLSMNMIKKAGADIIMGHLEINGSEMQPGLYCDHGLDRDLFKRYERVFSGHYHTQQDDGHIRYLGAPYEINWLDFNTAKGFHIYDTSTREFEFYQNPHRLFKKIYYDDGHSCDEMLNTDLTEYEGCFVKIVVIQKTDFYTFDRFIDRCYNEGNFYELKIVEDFSDLDHENLTEITMEEVEDTLTLLGKYVDDIDSEALNKNKLNRLLKSLYVEAVEVE